MPHYRLCLAAIALAIAACLIGGCEKQSADSQPDVFTWKDALASSPREAQEVLGEFDQCEEISPRWMRVGAGRSRGPNATWTRCVVSGNAKSQHEDYRVHAIAYLNERPLVVRLEPRSKAKVSRELLADWELPGLPFEHQLPPHVGKKLRAHLRYLALEPTAVGAVRGIEIFPSVDPEASDGTFDDYESVGFVRIYAQDKEHSISWLIEEAVPPPATPELVLPRLEGFVSSENPHAFYAEVGLGSFQIGDWPVYPTPPANAPVGRSGNPEFPRAKLTGESAKWVEYFDAQVRKRREMAETLRDEFEPKLHIAIDRSLPARELVELARRVDHTEMRGFALIGRDVSDTDERFEPGRGEVVESNFTLISRGAHSRERQHAPGLGLTVSIEAAGFAIEAGGKQLQPLDGCPEDGPTICRRDSELDAGEAVAEARRLQTAGELGASQDKIEESLASYDWPRLYETLTALKAKHPEESVIIIDVADPDAIVAVVAQVMRTSRHKLRAPGADECAESFEDAAAVREAVPCSVEGESHQPRPLFEHPMLLERSNWER